MNQNRAFEFLNEAYSLLSYPGNSDKARLLVRLAAGEVQELLDRLAELEATRPASPTSPAGRGVLIVDAQRATPALLAEQARGHRRALPANPAL